MKILIISECIVPYQSVASIRWTKIIKYLKRNHHIERIDVVTLDKKIDNNRVKSDALLKNDLKYIDHYYAVPAPMLNMEYMVYDIKKRFLTQSNEKQKGRKKNRKIRKKVYSLLVYFKQIYIALSVFHYIRYKIKIEQYDTVITSYGPEWTNLVGCKLSKKFKNMHWIADFRDQWNREFNKRNPERLIKKARRICSGADCLLRVNPYLELFESHRQKVVVIPNGFDPEEKLEPVKSEVFRIVYTGTVYTSDEMDALFHALQQLIHFNEIERSDLSIEYAGRTENLFIPYIQKYKFESNFINHHFISRKESLRLQSRSSLLLMAGWNTKNEKIVWSGKMYEYMMAKKPIVYLMAGEEKDCEAARSIELLGGVCYQTCRKKETFPILKKYILEKYREWKETGNVYIKRDDAYIEQFSYPRIADKVYQLLKKPDLHNRSLCMNYSQ